MITRKELGAELIVVRDLDCGSAELSVNLGLTRGHGHSLTYSTSGPVGHLDVIHFIRHAEPSGD